MRVWRRLSRIGLAFLFLSPLSTFAAAPTDQAAAESVLGPRWRDLSRRAGMIFTGTVINAGTVVGSVPGTGTAATTIESGASSEVRLGGNFLELHFRIDRPIAGVTSGQILTIHEWAGASSRQPALRSGDRVLLFLYPPSRLGLTSPVGGQQGQIRLDSTGENILGQNAAARNIAKHVQSPSSKEPSSKTGSPDAAAASAVSKAIPVSQIERSIRAARGE
jgi:hypothetical protein